jgi:DGQHR domain-containing protein
MNMEYIKIPVIKVTQQIGDFFVGKVTAEQIIKMSYSDVRRLAKEREVETYLGIQRPLDKSRAKEIQEYVKNVDATFPTSIILSVDSDNAFYDEENSILHVSDDSPAKILDGQHRVAGFMDIESGRPIKNLCWVDKGGDKKPFELLVTIFVGLDMAEQANIFATVNITQTKVSKSLVYDLEAYSKTRSPQKTAHEIVVALDNHEKSPFFNKVKRLGKKEGQFESLTQAALVEEIIKLISKSAMADRDFLLRKERGAFSSIRKGLDKSDYRDGLIFRNAFIDSRDDIILKTILAFFLSIENKWPRAWDAINKNSVFNRTVGINSLFRVLKSICAEIYLREEYRVVEQGEFAVLLDRIDIDDNFFETLDAKSATISYLSSVMIGKIGKI